MEYVGQSAAIGDAPWWSGGYNRGQFADVSSNAVRTEAVAGQVIAQNGFNREALGHHNDRMADLIMTNATNDRFNALCERLNDFQRDTASCCCDLKQQIATNRADLTALIKDTTIANLSADLQQCRVNESNQAQTNAIIEALSKGNS